MTVPLAIKQTQCLLDHARGSL